MQIGVILELTDLGVLRQFDFPRDRVTFKGGWLAVVVVGLELKVWGCMHMTQH